MKNIITVVTMTVLLVCGICCKDKDPYAVGSTSVGKGGATMKTTVRKSVVVPSPAATNSPTNPVSVATNTAPTIGATVVQPLISGIQAPITLGSNARVEKIIQNNSYGVGNNLATARLIHPGGSVFAWPLGFDPDGTTNIIDNSLQLDPGVQLKVIRTIPPMKDWQIICPGPGWGIQISMSGSMSDFWCMINTNNLANPMWVSYLDMVQDSHMAVVRVKSKGPQLVATFDLTSTGQVTVTNTFVIP